MQNKPASSRIYKLILLPFFFNGCATMSVMSQYKTTSIRSDYPNLTDSIIAIGKPDESILKKLNNPNALFFIGINKTFLLLEGGTILFDISKNLDPNKIIIDLKSKELYYTDEKIFGSFNVQYNSSGISESEKNNLVQLGFLVTQNGKTNQANYTRTITIKGLVKPAMNIPSTYTKMFTKNREISFYPPPKSALIPNIKNTAFLPFAVAVDVITSPIQALFVVMAVKEGFH